MIIGYHDDVISGLSALFASIGVLSTGLAAIFSAIMSARVTKKKANAECDQRIAELAKAWREGIRFADQRPRRRKGD